MRSFREAKSLLSVLGAVLTAVTANGCRRDDGEIPPRQLPTVEPLVFVVDASDSGAGDPKARCEVVRADLRRRALASRADRVDVLIKATGDAVHGGGTAQALLDWTSLQRNYRPFVDPEVIEAEYVAAVDQAAAACAQRITVAADSRIYQAVAEAVANVDARCATVSGDGARCDGAAISIMSDGQENGHPDLTRALRLAVDGKRWQDLNLPALHSKASARFQMCGFGATSRGAGLMAGRVRNVSGVLDVWQAVLGAGAVLDPNCPEARQLALQ